jgi:hypothetical protein
MVSTLRVPRAEAFAQLGAKIVLNGYKSRGDSTFISLTLRYRKGHGAYILAHVLYALVAWCIPPQESGSANAAISWARA